MRFLPSLLLALFVSLLTPACGAAGSSTPATVPVVSTPANDVPPLIADLEERTFRFFWDTANPVNGMVPDRYPTPSFASIAAVGFGLTAYAIGAERGYVTREAARARVLTTLRFLHDAPQGPAASGVIGYKGFYYHFIDMQSGHRYGTVELSTADTALLLAGVLFSQSYFDGAHADEAEIRRLAEAIYARVDWRWAQTRPPSIVLGWKPESGFLPEDYRGYNEAILVYLLALGSPTYPVDTAAWAEWTSTYDKTWGTYYGQEYLHYHPLFVHQFPHTWIDFRGIRDEYMRRRGIDYFENSRRAVLAQQAYAVANPLKWEGYGENVWGLSACDGPVDAWLPYAGEQRRFISYAGRGLGKFDDGTLTPYAAASSIAFAPEASIAAVQEMHRRWGTHIYATYGFVDAFNPSFRYDVPLTHGRVIPGVGWVDTDYLGIDQGPIVAMIENHRSGLIWRTLRRNPHIRRSLERAGFTGGWLETR